MWCVLRNARCLNENQDVINGPDVKSSVPPASESANFNVLVLPRKHRCDAARRIHNALNCMR